jgi:predicted nucleic acid-binding protein
MGAKNVVDTSVLIKWFKTSGEELGEEAQQLLQEVERLPVEVHVPACSNASAINLANASSLFKRVRTIPIE